SAEEICCVGGRLALEERRVLVEGAKTLRVTRFSPLECRQNEWMIVAASDAGFTGMPTKGILPARLVPIYISGLLKRVAKAPGPQAALPTTNSSGSGILPMR
ncbi:unnamed protein product, partial [Durusdinium trenchii]